MRILSRSKMTMAPTSSTASNLARLVRIAAACFLGTCHSLRKRINEGLFVRLWESNLAKSVSTLTRTRFSLAAHSNSASSGAACMPLSRTWTASCPACDKASATTGDSALSIRNFTNRITHSQRVEVAVPAMPRRQNAKLLEYPLVVDQDMRLAIHPPSCLPLTHR